jgi:hypothetical protein
MLTAEFILNEIDIANMRLNDRILVNNSGGILTELLIIMQIVMTRQS